MMDWKKIGIILLILMTGCIHDDTTKTIPKTEPIEKIHNHHIFEQRAQKKGVTLEEVEKFFKEVYGLNNEKEIFTQLPAMPTQFEEHTQVWKDGNMNKLAEITNATYMQPEFHPTFHTTGINTWINAPENKTYTIGIQSTPATQEAVISTQETEFDTTLFIGGGWGSTYYQGLSFRTTIEPETTYAVDFEPNDILVGPTFPAFSPEWMKKIRIRGTITPTEGTKEYVLRIYAKEPNPLLEKEWMEKYPPYIQVNTIIIDTEGLATLLLHVKE
ncbi:MAG: hypothetical protein V1776_00220 [Candidatus Diapherotrites archaeon]